MKKPVIISADSSCDLSPDLIEKYGIQILPITITLGDESYESDAITPEDIYSTYRAQHILPQTAAPSLERISEFFSQFTEKGYDVVHIDISGELSSTYNNARIVAEDFEGVYVVDSCMLSTGLGLLVIEAAECRDNGMDAADIAAHVSELTAKVDTSFVLDTLEFMWKGGRCTGVAAIGANLLALKPELEMKDGKLGVHKKYRGSIVNVYKQYIKDRLAGKSVRPGHVFITHSGEVDDAVIEELKSIVNSLIKVDNLHISTAGCTVASHCGPKTLGILFINE